MTNLSEQNDTARDLHDHLKDELHYATSQKLSKFSITNNILNPF